MFQRPALPEVEIYRVLSNARRREALTALWAHPDRLTLRALSEQIAASETGEDPAPRAHRESVYNTLHQTHLPKLDQLGLVQYDPVRKVVSARPAATHLGRYMDVTTRFGISWGEYYRALGVFGLFITVASLAGAPGFSVLDPLVPATLFLGVFAVSTSYQLLVSPFGLRGRVTQFSSRLRRKN
jgi:hypothetical protein